MIETTIRAVQEFYVSCDWCGAQVATRLGSIPAARKEAERVGFKCHTWRSGHPHHLYREWWCCIVCQLASKEPPTEEAPING